MANIHNKQWWKCPKCQKNDPGYKMIPFGPIVKCRTCKDKPGFVYWSVGDDKGYGVKK